MFAYRRARRVGATLIIAAFAPVLLPASLDARTVRKLATQDHPPESGSQLTRISELWAKEWGAKNLEALVALYAEDAVFMPATGSRVTGRPAIRELFAGALASHSSELRLHSRRSEQSGHLAFDSGEYEETSTTGGVKRSGKGNYLVVLRREGKNQWRIIQHMWTDVPTVSQ